MFHYLLGSFLWNNADIGKIPGNDQVHGKEKVKYRRIEILKSLEASFPEIGSEPEKWNGNSDLTVNGSNVRIWMMDDVMVDLPEIMTQTGQLKRPGEEPVQFPAPE